MDTLAEQDLGELQRDIQVKKELPQARTAPEINQEGVKQQNEGTISSVGTEQSLKNKHEDFDSLGRAEAATTHQPVLISHSLDCFPDTVKVQSDGMGGDVVDWWKLIKNNAPRWDVSVYREDSGDFEINLDFPRKYFLKEEDGILVDTRFATASTTPQPQIAPVQAETTPFFAEDSDLIGSTPSDYGEAEPDISDKIALTEEAINQGWQILNFMEDNWEDIVPKPGADYVVRGIQDAEMMSYLKTGFVQSRGDVVNDIGQKNQENAWTFFFSGSTPDGSFGFAAGGRMVDMATFDRPGYVIVLKRNEKIKTGSGDLYSSEPLPIDDITQIYEIRPIATGGNFKIHVFRNEHPEAGIRYFLENVNHLESYPQAVYAYKSISLDEVRKSLTKDREQTELTTQ